MGETTKLVSASGRENMTIELLEEYRGLSSGIEAIEAEIVSLYTPVSSLNGKEVIGTFGGMPGNPTEQAAMRIMSLKEKLTAERERMWQLVEEIEKWLLTVQDPEIVSIIRWHYLLGKNWDETNQNVYGYPSYYYARKKIMRFFDREE